MASKSAPSKRPQSTAVATAKPQCRIHPTAIVADKAQITGSYVVDIGENVVIHPHARIKAEHGNVVIGKGCQIAEKAIVGPPENETETDVVLGEGVSIESGVVIEAKKIGDYSTIEVNAEIRAGALVGKWCKVAPVCEVGESEVLDDFTVVFGEGQKGRRIDVVVREKKEVRDAKLKGKAMEMEVLRGLIPDGKVKWTG